MSRGRTDEVIPIDAEYPHSIADGEACPACRKQIIAGSFYITIAGLVLKGIIGYLCGSRALMADAMHSLADTVCFGLNYVGSRATPSNQPRTDLARNGVIGSVIVVSGVWVFADNAAAILSQTLARPGLIGFIVAAVSAFTNWRLHKVSECVKKRFEDSASFVCAAQNKTNFYAACLSLLGVLLADAGLRFFDPLCAIIIGFFLMVTGGQILNEAFTKNGPVSVFIKKVTLLTVGVLSLFIVSFYGYRISDNLNHNRMILVPAQGTTIASPMDSVLGRAQYFIVIDSRANKMAVFKNEIRLNNADVSNTLMALIRDYQVEVVIAYKIGTEMFTDMEAAGVKMYYTAGTTTVEQAISDYRQNRLEAAVGPNVNKRYGQIGWLRPW